ncbi:hypothetical protein [Acinetobacter sp.]|uniref:hypothetical protein n=1 Tax=Acinetobacter sp. TaxID=472 RepID=UPI00388E2F7B
MKLLKELVGLHEAKDIDFKSMKSVASVDKPEDIDGLNISGKTIIFVYYADHPSLTNAEEKMQYRSIKSAAEAVGGKVRRRKEFADYEVANIPGEKLKEFFNNYNDDLTLEDDEATKYGFGWNFEIYQVE